MDITTVTAGVATLLVGQLAIAPAVAGIVAAIVVGKVAPELGRGAVHGLDEEARPRAGARDRDGSSRARARQSRPPSRPTSAPPATA